MEMNDEIKETLEYKIDFLTKSLNIGIPTKNRRYFNDIKDYITNLQERCAYLERSNDRREDTILGLRQELDDVEQQIDKALDEIQYIIDYGFDYDGFNTVESLKGLIDMLVDYARESKNILQNGGDDNE